MSIFIFYAINIIVMYNKSKFVKNKKLYLNLKGGAFALYTTYSRQDAGKLRQINKEYVDNLIIQAKKLGRYYINTENEQSGVHSAFGPRGFDIEKFKKEHNVKIDIDMYESIFIWKKLEQMNEIIKNIYTIQSGIAYYENDSSFSPEYFQLPFVEFKAPLNYWSVVKSILEQTKKYKYLSSTFIDTKYHINKDVNATLLRFCILRPYVDENNVIVANTFDDEEFFDNIINILFETNKMIISRKIEISDIKNDLDINKDWYILSNDGIIKKYHYNKHFVHPDTGIPLTTLNVSYNNDYKSFFIDLDINKDWYILSNDGIIKKYYYNKQFVHPDTGIPLTTLNVRYNNEYVSFMHPI